MSASNSPTPGSQPAEPPSAADQRPDSGDAEGYLHGFTETEAQRLYHQARFIEHRIHESLPLTRARNLLEIGCGVGAQTEILLRRHPELHVTGVDRSPDNLARARQHLSALGWAEERWDHVAGDGGNLEFESNQFDSAFLCWVLEHVPDPTRVLSEVRRCLRPGSPVIITEVQNMSFFVDPYSPNLHSYWLAFNDYQLELGGDPFVGAKLGNLLQAVGYRDIFTKVKTIHLDNRSPGERADFLAFWSDLLLSGSAGLLEAGRTTQEVVDGMREELKLVSRNPNAVFYYAFVQATARVW